MDKYTDQATALLQEALGYAAEQRHAEADPLHLFFVMLRDRNSLVHPLLDLLEVSEETLLHGASGLLEKLPRVEYGGQKTPLSRGFAELLQRGESERKNLRDEYLSTEHLILACTKDRQATGELCRSHGLTRERVLTALKQVRGSRQAATPQSEDAYRALERYCKDLTAEARRGALDPVIGRSEEVRRIVQVLARRTKNNPVLIGEPGVGKTAIVEEMAQRIVNSDVPESLRGHRIVSLDIGSLLAGAQYRGEFEERLKHVIEEVTQSEGGIVLFVDELHTLMGAGKSDGTAIDAANLLKPALSRGALQMIGATTLDEYRNYIEKDAAFERRFQPIYTDEPSVEESIAILRGLKERYEVYHGVRIQDAALVAAVRLSHRYITERYLPDKAIDLIDEASSRLKISIESQPEDLDLLERQIRELNIERKALEKDSSAAEKLEGIKKELAALETKQSRMRLQWNHEKGLIEDIRRQKRQIEELSVEEARYEREGKLDLAAEIKYGKLPRIAQELKDCEAQLSASQQKASLLREEVSEEDVAVIVSNWTGIPLKKMLAEEQQRFLELEEILSRRVVGQQEAILAVSRVLRRNRSGLASPDRPMGVFLFLGPSGVGKTELAKALTEFLFDDEKSLRRIDMSEYMEKHAVSRLVGAPPGYVGYEEGGQLTEAVRRRPYSVILLDEIEKAHPDIYNVLLQLLDEGRLTDGQGRTVDFRNSIIIMTSNLASDRILEVPDVEAARPDVEAALQRSFRPEFRNRLDEIIIFQRLEAGDIRVIVDLELDKLRARLLDQGVDIVFQDKLCDAVAERGFDARLGARPLQRAIRRTLEDPLAVLLLSRDLKGKTIHADLRKGAAHFTVKESA